MKVLRFACLPQAVQVDNLLSGWVDALTARDGGKGVSAWVGGLERGSGMGVSLYGLGRGEQGSGLDAGDGAALGEGDGEVGGSDGIGEFGDSQDVKSSGGEEDNTELTAEILDGSTDGLKGIFRVLNDFGPGFGSNTDLMAKIGHGTSQFRREGQRKVWRACADVARVSIGKARGEE